MSTMVPMTGGMAPASPQAGTGNPSPWSPAATMGGYGMMPAGSAVQADMMQAMAAGGMGSPGMPVMGSPIGSPMWNQGMWQGYFQNFYNSGGMGMQQSPMGMGTVASPAAATATASSAAAMPATSRFTFEEENESPTAHGAMKGQSFVIGQRSGKWGLPLGLTTVHRHVPLTKIQINHKVCEIRQWWLTKEQARKAGKKRIKRLAVLLQPKPATGGMVETGSIILSTKPKHFKQWLGPASKTRDYRPSERTAAKASSRGKSRKTPKVAARGGVGTGSAAKMLNMVGSRGNSPNKPASGKKPGRKTAAQRKQAAAQAQQATQLAALQKQAFAGGYTVGPTMAPYGMGYPHVAAGAPPATVAPKQVARRVNLDNTRVVDQTDSELDSDDGSELGELSSSGSEEDLEEEQPVYQKKKGRVKKKPSRLEKLAKKKDFPNAIVLVGSQDPTNIRVFETAAKTRNYLGVKNPSTFYDARRNQNALRGWFIFDGPDYAKKKGSPITYEMISQTDVNVKAEALEKRKKRQEEREKAGVAGLKKTVVAPISRSRRATAGKAAAKLGAEASEDDAPALSDEEPVCRLRKPPSRYDDEVEEKPQRLTKKKKVKQEVNVEEESQSESEVEPENKPQRRKAPPPRCVCGRYFSSQAALESHQQDCPQCTDAAPAASPPAKRRKKASPATTPASGSGSRQIAANRAAAQAAAQASAAHAANAATAMSVMYSPGDRKPRLDDELNDLPASKRYIPGYGLHKPQIPDSFNFKGLKPVPLRIQTYQSRTRAETQQMAVQSPTSPRSRPILQSLQAPISPPSCPEDVADMSRFPLLRIGDTFEMEFDLASNTNEVGTNFDEQWRLQPAAEHAAFGLTNELTKVTFESYYYDFHNGLVCLRCQEAPINCNCTYPNDLIDLSTRMSNLVQKSDSSSSGKLKICCKIPRKRDHGRSNSWNSNLRTIHGKSPKVMLLRVIERALQTNMTWKVVSVQQGYCRLIAKNGGLDLAYGEGSAGKNRRSSIGSMSPTSPGLGQRFTFLEGARNPMSPTVMEDDAEREAFGSSPIGSPIAGRSWQPSASGGYEAGGMHYQLVGKFNHAEDDDKFASKKSGRSNLPSASTAVLKQWLSDHADNPYPTDTQKRALALQLGLSHNQVSYWFINARRRILGKTMVSKSPTGDQTGRGKRKSYK